MDLMRFLSRQRRLPAQTVRDTATWFFSWSWLRAGQGLALTREPDGVTIGLSPTAAGQGLSDERVAADSADPTPGYLDAKVQHSLAVDATAHALELAGDLAAPGAYRDYGTDAAGDRGWQALSELTFLEDVRYNDAYNVLQKRRSSFYARGYTQGSWESFAADPGDGIDEPAEPLEPDDATVAADLAMWLDAAALTGLADEDPLATWTDESGNGNSPTASGSARPEYQTGVVNGLPAVYFDGSDDVLYKAGSLLPSGGDWTLFVVAQGGGNWSPISSNDGTSDTGAGDTSWYTAKVASDLAHAVGWKSSAALAAFDTAWHIASFDHVAGSTLRAWLDNVACTSLNDTWHTADVSLGRYHNGGTFVFFEGHLAEVVLYDRKLTDAERVGVIAYLSSKYSITVAA